MSYSRKIALGTAAGLAFAALAGTAEAQKAPEGGADAPAAEAPATEAPAAEAPATPPALPPFLSGGAEGGAEAAETPPAVPDTPVIAAEPAPSLPEPAFGSVQLTTGFLPDPHVAQIVAGGENRYDDGTGCGGFIATAPDYRVSYTAGTQYNLSFVAESVGDLVLVVRAPDGTMMCNDDYFQLNPAMTFTAPMSGDYNIWVGTYAPGEYPQSQLYVTEYSLD